MQIPEFFKNSGILMGNTPPKPDASPKTLAGAMVRPHSSTSLIEFGHGRLDLGFELAAIAVGGIAQMDDHIFDLFY